MRENFGIRALDEALIYLKILPLFPGERRGETKTQEEGRKAADALPDRKTIDDFGVAAPCLCSVTPPNFLREHRWGRRGDFETGTPKTRSRPFSRVARNSPTKYEN